MTNIHGIQPPMEPKAVEAAGHATAPQAKTQPLEIQDAVEISHVAKLAAKIQQLPDVRAELVQRVKAEIAAGTYQTPERLEIAVDRLMDELLTQT